MESKLKKGLAKAGHYAKVIWEIPAIKSVALTWLVRLGVPGGAILIAVVDALASK